MIYILLYVAGISAGDNLLAQTLGRGRSSPQPPAHERTNTGRIWHQYRQETQARKDSSLRHGRHIYIYMHTVHRKRTTCNSTIADANAIQIRLSRLPQPHRNAVLGLVSRAIRRSKASSVC